MKDYRNVKIEYHVLQSFPVTCLNRDDVGAPKTAFVGGVKRGRISSQCWKRQVRLALRDFDIRIAVRTKKISEMIMKSCSGEMSEEKRNFIDTVASVIQSKDTLFYISDAEITALASYVDSLASYELDKKEVEKRVKDILKKNGPTGGKELDGLDIALFGRMAANAVELNVQAASSFSHAITTHKVSYGMDFFTAVDDFSNDGEDAGAGHIGSSEFTSGTDYRYISLDLGLLSESLDDDDAMLKAVDAFTKALYVAVPAARQTTFAGYCPWNYARLLVRKGQPLQLSFEKPVKAGSDGGFTEPSIEALDAGLARNEKLMGSLYGKIGDFTYGRSDKYGIDALCADLKAVLAALPER